MKKFVTSFKYAIDGFIVAFKTQLNFRIETFAAIAVISAGAWFRVTSIEWMFIMLNISIVLSLELINTAIENTCDFVCKKKNPVMKIIKDVSAAAVLLAAIASIICGAMIFLPKILK